MIDVPYILPKEYLDLTQKYAIINQKPLLYELTLSECENSKFKASLLNLITKCLDYNYINRPNALELKNSFIELEENILYEASITEVNLFKNTMKENEYSSQKYKFYENIKKGIYQKEKLNTEDQFEQQDFRNTRSNNNNNNNDNNNNNSNFNNNYIQKTASDLKLLTQTNITTTNHNIDRASNSKELSNKRNTINKNKQINFTTELNRANDFSWKNSTNTNTNIKVGDNTKSNTLKNDGGNEYDVLSNSKNY